MNLAWLVLAAGALAAEPCGPDRLVGKWGGAFSCAGTKSGSGRADVAVEKKGNGYLARYSISERLAGGKTSTTSGTTPLTPEGGRKGVYRATVKLDPRNPLRIRSIGVFLTFQAQKDGRCVVFHQADLGSMSAMASLKGHTFVEKKTASVSSAIASPIFNNRCSGKLARGPSAAAEEESEE